MRSDSKYLMIAALLAILAVAFGVFGTVAPPLAEEGGLEPQQESPSESGGHFQNPPSYDSGWVDITTKAGEYFAFEHGLNTTDVVVDVTGKRGLEPQPLPHPEKMNFYRGPYRDIAYSMIQTSDGGYAIAGFTASVGAEIPKDFWLVKTDSGSTIQWNKTYVATGDQVAHSVIQTSDGGYALAGYNYGALGYDMLLVKTDSTGNHQWNTTYASASNEYACSVVQDAYGFTVFGYTDLWGAGGYDMCLLRTNSAGSLQWIVPYGGPNDDYGWSMIHTSDGGYALAGETYSYGAGSADFWLVKTDSDGVPEWNQTYGASGHERARSVVQTSDGGYALAGSQTGVSSLDFWLVKTDATGNLQWNKKYDSTYEDYAYSVVQTADGGYAVAGYLQRIAFPPPPNLGDTFIVRTNSTGDLYWSKTFGNPNPVIDIAYSLVYTNEGGYAMAGYSNFIGGEYDFAFYKWDAEWNREQHVRYWSLSDTHIFFSRHEMQGSYWNYLRVRIWLIKEPAWIYGDLNMDGIVDAKDLYIIGRNYGKTFSILSLGGIAALAGIRTHKKRKQENS